MNEATNISQGSGVESAALTLRSQDARADPVPGRSFMFFFGFKTMSFTLKMNISWLENRDSTKDTSNSLIFYVPTQLVSLVQTWNENWHGFNNTGQTWIHHSLWSPWTSLITVRWLNVINDCPQMKQWFFFPETDFLTTNTKVWGHGRVKFPVSIKSL